jgi:hypothetical protein
MSRSANERFDDIVDNYLDQLAEALEDSSM